MREQLNEIQESAAVLISTSYFKLSQVADILYPMCLVISRGLLV